ncbi:hypothetical protein D8S78_20695 [Natrialba swarupiae]|nr:hypothetical protein [Natrialba swarupiae]
MLVTKLAEGESVTRPIEYKTNVTYRWVLPNEILHFLKSGIEISDMIELFQSPFKTRAMELSHLMIQWP